MNINLTRNTKLYKISCTINKKKEDVYFRDLNALEYKFLSNIKNEAFKADMAGRLVIVNRDPNTLSVGTIIEIGNNVLFKISDFLNSTQLFEITISELRDNLKKDDFMIAIKNILTYLPGQSITELLKLTLKDLLELVCLCELVIGKPIINSGKKHGLITKGDMTEDDSKSLQNKMNALNSELGGIPR